MIRLLSIGLILSFALSPHFLFAQERDRNGNGTITNMGGSFSMSVPENAVLQFSYIGFASREIAVNGKKDIQVVLEENYETLDEVVVTGYATQRKINLSGSVDQVTAKQLEARPVTNIAKGLQGMVPNLNCRNIRGKGVIWRYFDHNQTREYRKDSGKLQ
ncbi:MAG: carboxypeptidase-like regulatory domain-containing protein [Prevotellaceae bacterium]|jgi:hypothetical protein|nr:carboxypeptidase-like regulatory domain-containing protein [Prevotellaceae bacterium]